MCSQLQTLGAYKSGGVVTRLFFGLIKHYYFFVLMSVFIVNFIIRRIIILPSFLRNNNNIEHAYECKFRVARQTRVQYYVRRPDGLIIHWPTDEMISVSIC